MGVSIIPEAQRSKFKLSARSIRKLEGVHTDLDVWVRHLIQITPIDFVVLEGLRSVERQRELVASGASQTMQSRHIDGCAVDLGAWVGEVRWDMGLYLQIADAGRLACKETGIPIRWGGAWARLDQANVPAATLVAEYVAERKRLGKKPFIDSPHFELPSTRYPA